MELTPRQRRRLAAKAHHLKPVVQVGDRGVTETLLAEVDRALTDHELIKVRIQSGDRDARRELLDAIRAQTDAHLVQVIGRIGVLYRPDSEEPRIQI